VHSELRDCILGLYQEMRHKQELHFELHKRARELHHVLSVLHINQVRNPGGERFPLAERSSSSK